MSVIAFEKTKGSKSKGRKGNRQGKYGKGARTPPEAPTDPARLARRYLTRHATDAQNRRIVHYWRGEWWCYDRGRYIRKSGSTIKAALTRHIKAEIVETGAENRFGNQLQVTNNLLNNTLHWLSTLAEVSDELEQPTWLGKGSKREYFCFTNGLVPVGDLLRGSSVQLQPHTPEWFTCNQFPYGFNVDAKAPRWIRFLNHVLESDQDRIAQQQEWFGYNLVPDTSQQKFMVDEGEGANGKSVVLTVLTDLLGPENVSSVGLDVFGDRFQLAATIGKLANICADMNAVDRVAEGYLKQFTSGDRMTIDRKHRDPVQVVPTARLTLSTNVRPRIADKSSGVWRRMLLVPFRVSIPEHEQDKQLTEKLRKELPGIFNWAVEGLRRLRERGRFTESRVGAEALREYRMESNPARVYLMERTRLDPSTQAIAGALYANYKTWCSANGFAVVDSREFGKELKKIHPSLNRVRVNTVDGRQWGYRGLAHDPLWPMSDPFASNIEKEEEVEK